MVSFQRYTKTKKSETDYKPNVSALAHHRGWSQNAHLGERNIYKHPKEYIGEKRLGLCYLSGPVNWFLKFVIACRTGNLRPFLIALYIHSAACKKVYCSEFSTMPPRSSRSLETIPNTSTFSSVFNCSQPIHKAMKQPVLPTPALQ